MNLKMHAGAAQGYFTVRDDKGAVQASVVKSGGFLFAYDERDGAAVLGRSTRPDLLRALPRALESHRAIVAMR